MTVSVFFSAYRRNVFSRELILAAHGGRSEGAWPTRDLHYSEICISGICFNAFRKYFARIIRCSLHYISMFPNFHYLLSEGMFRLSYTFVSIQGIEGRLCVKIAGRLVRTGPLHRNSFSNLLVGSLPALQHLQCWIQQSHIRQFWWFRRSQMGLRRRDLAGEIYVKKKSSTGIRRWSTYFGSHGGKEWRRQDSPVNRIWQELDWVGFRGGHRHSHELLALGGARTERIDCFYFSPLVGSSRVPQFDIHLSVRYTPSAGRTQLTAMVLYHENRHVPMEHHTPRSSVAR